jgi:hypothetical protein
MAQESGRFTPKKSETTSGAAPGSTGSSSGASIKKTDDAPAYAASGRYTPRQAPPVPTGKVKAPESPAWVAWLMFAFFAAGLVLIVLNYGKFFWDTTNTVLIAGLGCIVAGFITATRLR